MPGMPRMLGFADGIHVGTRWTLHCVIKSQSYSMWSWILYVVAYLGCTVAAVVFTVQSGNDPATGWTLAWLLVSQGTWLPHAKTLRSRHANDLSLYVYLCMFTAVSSTYHVAAFTADPDSAWLGTLRAVAAAVSAVGLVAGLLHAFIVENERIVVTPRHMGTCARSRCTVTTTDPCILWIWIPLTALQHILDPLSTSCVQALTLTWSACQLFRRDRPMVRCLHVAFALASAWSASQPLSPVVSVAPLSACLVLVGTYGMYESTGMFPWRPTQRIQWDSQRRFYFVATVSTVAVLVSMRYPPNTVGYHCMHGIWHASMLLNTARTAACDLSYQFRLPTPDHEDVQDDIGVYPADEDQDVNKTAETNNLVLSDARGIVSV